MGDTAAPGPASFAVSAPVPQGARTVLLHNGEPLAQADGGALTVQVAAAEGAFRVELLVPGSPGNPPIPWILSNPIYFEQARGALHPANTPPGVPLPPGIAWHIEKDRGSSGSVVTSAAEAVFFYRLRGPSRTSQFAAAVAELQGRAPATGAVTFSASAVRPARLSVQLRYAGGERWGRSVYLDSTPRDLVVTDRRDASGRSSERTPARRHRRCVAPLRCRSDERAARSSEHGSHRKRRVRPRTLTGVRVPASSFGLQAPAPGFRGPGSGSPLRAPIPSCARSCSTGTPWH